MEIKVLEKPTKKMTFEEFLDWCDEDARAEWVDGEVIVFSPAADRHQDLSGFLAAILRIYVETRNLGWLRFAPFLMHLPELKRAREPDILFVSEERREIIHETYLDGPADLVVEIVSEDSLARDRGEKFIEYEKAGVKEYWLSDTERERAEFYQLDEKGHFQAVLPDKEGIYRSKVLSGFWLRISWLWESPLPSTLRVLAEIAGVEPTTAEAFEKALGGP
ncbi:MAG: Uma2 family endonuclease [Anaerolineae bacterium]